MELSDLLSPPTSLPTSRSPPLLHPSLPALITSSALHYSLYSQSSFSPSVSPHQSRLLCLFFNLIMESNPPERAGGQRRRRQNHFQGACVSQQVWEHLWSQFWLGEVELCYCASQCEMVTHECRNVLHENGGARTDTAKLPGPCVACWAVWFRPQNLKKRDPL